MSFNFMAAITMCSDFGILKSRHITLPTKVRLVKNMVFQLSCMNVSQTIKLSAEELMLLNCGVGEDS